MLFALSKKQNIKHYTHNKYNYFKNYMNNRQEEIKC